MSRVWTAGHSWGGDLGQDYMAHHPDRCLGAFPLCTLDPANPSDFEGYLTRVMARAGDPGCDAALEAAQRFMAESEGMTCRVEAMVAEKPQGVDRVSIDVLPTVDVPTVIVAATDDFVCSPPKNQRVHRHRKVAPAVPGRSARSTSRRGVQHLS